MLAPGGYMRYLYTGGRSTYMELRGSHQEWGKFRSFLNHPWLRKACLQSKGVDEGQFPAASAVAAACCWVAKRVAFDGAIT